MGLDFDLDAIETPSDSESLPFPIYDLDLEGERSKVKTAENAYTLMYSCNLSKPLMTSRDCFPDDLQRLGLASRRNRGFSSSPRSKSDFRTGSGPGTDQSGLGALEREDVIDSQGTRWRCFSTGDPPQESRVDMSVLEPFLRVLSHGGMTSHSSDSLPGGYLGITWYLPSYLSGYCGDGMNDIIVFSSCYLPQNSLENYQYVMDHLFR